MNITAIELLERYAAGERNFAGVIITSDRFCTTIERADLSDIILSGAYLYQFRLREVVLTNAKLIGVYMYGVDLQFANLRRADFTGATLAGACLECADLSFACLNGANLTGANVNGADLTKADLQFSNLSNVDLSVAYLPEGIESVATLEHAFIWQTTFPDGHREIIPRYYEA